VGLRETLAAAFCSTGVKLVRVVVVWEHLIPRCCGSDSRWLFLYHVSGTLVFGLFVLGLVSGFLLFGCLSVRLSLCVGFFLASGSGGSLRQWQWEWLSFIFLISVEVLVQSFEVLF